MKQLLAMMTSVVCVSSLVVVGRVATKTLTRWQGLSVSWNKQINCRSLEFVKILIYCQTAEDTGICRNRKYIAYNFFLHVKPLATSRKYNRAES